MVDKKFLRASGYRRREHQLQKKSNAGVVDHIRKVVLEDGWAPECDRDQDGCEVGGGVTLKNGKFLLRSFQVLGRKGVSKLADCSYVHSFKGAEAGYVHSPWKGFAIPGSVPPAQSRWSQVLQQGDNARGVKLGISKISRRELLEIGINKSIVFFTQNDKLILE